MPQAATSPANPMIGHNNPPTDDEDLREYLEKDSQALIKRADDLKEALARLPEKIEDDATEEKVTDFVKQVQTCVQKMETAREKHKKPFWNAGQFVDGFFNPRKKALKDIQDSALKIIETYREAKRKAAAEEARAAALRAKNEEQTRLDAAAEAEKEAAALRETGDTEGAVKLEATAEKKLDSAVRMETRGVRFDALASSGGRAAVTRADSGAAAMDIKRWQATLKDRNTLDLEALRPYFTEDGLQRALNGFKDAYVQKLKTEPQAPIPEIRGALVWLETKTAVR